MAEYGPFINAHCLFNSVDLSAYVTSIQLTLGTETLDLTAMGDLGRVPGAGIESHTLSITFNEDLGAAAVHATLRAAWATKAAFPVTFKLVNAAISATNPEYQCSYFMQQLPFGGQHGQKLVTTVTLQSSGVMTIDVTP